MNAQLENAFAHWLDTVARPNWSVVEEEIAANRASIYPQLQSYLTRRPVDVAGFATLAGECPLMTMISSYAATPYKSLFADPLLPQRIERLIDYLPESHDEVAGRINEFVEAARPNGLWPSQSAAIASLLLTVAYPRRFVDYPSQISWQNFAQALGYSIPADGTSHGEWIIWASGFALDLAQSEPFRQQWKNIYHPTWIVSGLNWTHKRISGGN